MKVGGMSGSIMKKTALHIMLSTLYVFGSLYLFGTATMADERYHLASLFRAESRPVVLSEPHIYRSCFWGASAGVACLAFLAGFLDYKFRRPAWHVAVVLCAGMLLLVIMRMLYNRD